jgi:superfamily II RNA helicase
MEELEKVEHEKPMKEFLYENFNRFRDHHPWLANENVRPKSIVREMYSTYQTFAEYVREYGLQRSEGVLLRYLSSVYKVLVHTVPDHLKTDAVDEVILYLKTEIKSTDSSLLDEWEKMHDPQAFAEKKEQAIQDAAETEEDITKNQKTLEKNVRNKILRFIKALSLCQYEYALSFLEPSGNLWNEKTLEEVMAMYYESHKNLSLAREARRPEHIQFDMSTEDLVIVEQTMVDDELQNDWYLQFKIDLEKTKSNQEVSLVLLKISER